MPKPVFRLEPPHVPYFLEEAVNYIETLIDEDTEVFEYGSGASTLWFAERVKRVVSVEHDPEWAEEVERALREAQLISKVKLIIVDGEEHIAGAIDSYNEFDLVLVDCLDRRRTEAVSAAMGHVRAGGYLVMDDSQWRMSRPARDALEAIGWQRKIFRGRFQRHNGDIRPHETSVYQRPPAPGAAEEEE